MIPRSLHLACALALATAVVGVASPALAQVSLTVSIAPPELPVYEQPVLVDDGAIWTPGYWAYGPDGYYWVPGAWEQPPDAGMLWTPGYWRWGGGGYRWNAGYWGATVGYYGGIDYGYGYSGRGYDGGRWEGGHFRYNTAVSHINVTSIHNVYSQPPATRGGTSRVSFNGGRGGNSSRPTAGETAAAHAQHSPATPTQAERRETASRTPAHAADLPAIKPRPVPASGNAERDRANQQEQDTLRNGQEQQRQQLQQRQASEHAEAARQGAAASANQALERQHQVQTQELVQRHATEQHSLQQRQSQPAPRPAEEHAEPRGR
jgi:hypothetical protein